MRLLDRLLRGRAVPAPAIETPKPPLAKIGSDGKPYPALTTLIEQFKDASRPPDALVLGDSVMERIAREDDDRRTLGEMIADELAPARSAVISASANNPVVYRWLLAVLVQMQRGPKRVILPINLRCFSPQWHMNPDWQMRQEVDLLFAYMLHGARDIPAIADVHRDDAGHAALADAPLDFPLSQRRTMGAFRALAGEPHSDARSREIFVFHYTHRLVPDHPKLIALRDAVLFAASICERVTLYVTPLNVEAADRFVGPAFREVVRANVETLKAALPLPFCDWHDALPESAFFHGDTATEHLNQSGRLALARMVAAA